MSAIGSIIGGVGDMFASSDYSKAASLYRQDIALAKESTALKEAAANRAIFQSMGKTRTEVGGSNFKLGGSFGAILRSSVTQASQYKGQIQIQGAIEENSYAAQAAAADAQATQQLFAGISGITSGLVSGGSSAAAGGSTLDILMGG